MNNFDFYRPTRYIFGHGCENDTGSYAKEYGFKKALVVSGGNFAKRSGLLARVCSSLERAGISYVSLEGVKPNPRADLVYKGIELGRSENADFLLAVGGGSVIDTAKAIALGIPYEGDFFDFFLGKSKPQKALKTAVVLTIPAAGSEGSNSAVIEKEINGNIVKNGLGCDFNVPLFSVMDPELTFTLPAYQTACGVTDMMAHIMERYFTNTQNVDVTDRMCEGLLCSIIANAPVAITEPDNYSARANLMWAGTMAHNNICGVGREQDWATHHLEHQLSALYDVAHGAGLAVMFPAWMEYCLRHDVMRFAQFAVRVFGISMDYEKPERTAKAGIAALRAFLKRIGMPLNFEQIGAHSEDIPKLLDMLGVDDHERFEGHFVKLHRSDCEKIYKLAAEYRD
ncbi:MAG: iron-containing alcohol dehydrogenase [Succinatimonas sp.]|nr:iron-containing alcohol dehydrogenase [Succinatimonas sp.]